MGFPLESRKKPQYLQEKAGPNSHIPTVFPHRFPANSHALTSGEGTGIRRDGLGDSGDVYLEGEESQSRWLQARDLHASEN